MHLTWDDLLPPLTFMKNLAIRAVQGSAAVGAMVVAGPNQEAASQSNLQEDTAGIGTEKILGFEPLSQFTHEKDLKWGIG